MTGGRPSPSRPTGRPRRRSPAAGTTRRRPRRRPARSAGPTPASASVTDTCGSSRLPAAAAATGPSAAARTSTLAPRRAALAAASAATMSSTAAANTTTMSRAPTQSGRVGAATTGALRTVRRAARPAGRRRRAELAPIDHERPRPVELAAARPPVRRWTGPGRRPTRRRQQRRRRPRPTGWPESCRSTTCGLVTTTAPTAGPTGRLVQQQHRDAVPDREDPAAFGAGQRGRRRVTRGSRG